jgi:hypothetical protein
MACDHRRQRDPFRATIAAAPQHLAPLRRTLRQWLDASIDDPLCRADVLLAASELAAAAVRATTEPHAAVSVSAWVEDGDVVVESVSDVTDRGFVGGPATFGGGDGERSLSVVAALSDVFAVRGVPSGVCVQARMTGGRCDRFGSRRTG